MKRMLTVILAVSLLLGLSGCGSSEGDFVEKIAVDTAVSYLNNKTGYDIEEEYYLKGPFINGEQIEKVYDLYENDRFMVRIHLFYNKDMLYGGIPAYPYEDGYLFVETVDKETVNIEGWEDKSRKIAINDHLYLEDIKEIRTAVTLEETPDRSIKRLREEAEYLIENWEFYEIEEPKKGDVLTVYDYIRIVTFDFDRETGIITIVHDDKVRHYPVYKNGKPYAIISLTVDSPYDEGGTGGVRENSDWYRIMECRSDYVLASWTLVTADGRYPEGFVPVLLQKTMRQLRQLAEELPEAEKLLEITVME